MPGLFVRRHALAVAQFCTVATLYVKSYFQQNKTEQEWQNQYIPELYIYSHKSAFSPINYLRFISHHYLGLKSIKKKWGKYPDLIHVNVLTREGVMALWFKWMYSIPYVVTEHWSRYGNPETFKGPLIKYLTQLVLNNASAVMPVTANLLDKMTGAGLRLPNVTIVPNVVDTDRFVPLKQKVRRAKTRFIHISCFDEKAKNVKGILRVIKALSDVNDSFEIILIGDGPDFKDVKAYADTLQIIEGVFAFKGLLEGEALIHEIQQADAHVMFSNYENLPVVNLECFACGIPVISSDVGGIHEFFNSDLGVLVEPGNEEALKEVLLRFIQKEISFESTKIRAYAIENFSQQKVGEKINLVYNQALKSI